MGKYLVLWQLDGSRIAVDPVERRQSYGQLLAIVRQDMEKGLILDWGSFAGEGRGYSIMEGSEIDIASQLQQFVPYCQFKVHPIMSVTQVNEMIQRLTA